MCLFILVFVHMYGSRNPKCTRVMHLVAVSDCRLFWFSQSNLCQASFPSLPLQINTHISYSLHEPIIKDKSRR